MFMKFLFLQHLLIIPELLALPFFGVKSICSLIIVNKHFNINSVHKERKEGERKRDGEE